MQKNYSVVPFKDFNCSQNYDGIYSHYSQSHSTNGIKSYPIDVVDDIYCGCDEMKVVKINGVGNGTVNQIFVQSTTPVIMPFGTYYITYLITHPTDADIGANLYIGKIIHRNELIIHKGTDGGVGAHIDLVIAKSLQAGWVMNSAAEWVLPDSIKPEDGFYLDDTFTTMSNPNGINFPLLPADAYLTIPTPVEENKNVDQVKVICGNNTLRVRTTSTTSGAFIGFATPGIYNIISTAEADGYTWYQVEVGKWFANAPGCTEFIKKYVAPVVEEPVVDTPIENNPEEPQEPSKEDGQTNTPTNDETVENGANNEENKHNTIIDIVLFILREIIKLFKGGK